MEKQHWDNFVKAHSAGTAAHVKTILGTKVSEEDFILAHKATCQSKKYSARACGRDLYKFLRKYSYLN